MNPALNGIWEHIRDLGLGALAHANRHAAYAAMENPRWPELSVVQAAHSAELLIKARIAQEHPLLIFEQLPRFTQASNATLELEDLFKLGRTVQWNELPDRLWASTGISLQNKENFDNFGKLRNGIQHFGPPPDKDAAEETLRFIFGVIDPFINGCWDLFAIDFDEDYEPYVYFVEALVSREVPFLVSPAAAAEFDNWEVDWSQVSEQYRSVICHRVEIAKTPTSASSS